MTIQDQKAAVKGAQELWALILPGVPPPDDYRFWMWTSLFPMEAVTRGIVRSGAKHRKMASSPTPMTAEDTARYCSSVIRNEAETMGVVL